MFNSNKIYNNADSFSMAFDEAWKTNNSQEEVAQSKEDKLEKILNIVKDHPFLKNSPNEARRVANFRIRLLKLK